MPINNNGYSCYTTAGNLFNQSYEVHITPLVINGLGHGHTQTRIPAIHTGSILRNQSCAGLLPVHTNKGIPGHSLGEPPKQVQAKVRVIALYSLDMMTEVTEEPLTFSTAKTQLIKTLQQQGRKKRIECLSHIAMYPKMQQRQPFLNVIHW